MRKTVVSFLVVLSFVFCIGAGGSFLWGWMAPLVFPRMVSDGYLSSRIPISVSVVFAFVWFIFWMLGMAARKTLGKDHTTSDYGVSSSKEKE